MRRLAAPAAEAAGGGVTACTGAATGAEAPAALASVSICAISSPEVTVSPLALMILTSTPSAGAGVSSTTLSVSMSMRFSSRETASPSFLCHATSVASETDSDSCGTLTSISMEFSPWLFCQFGDCGVVSWIGPKACSITAFCCWLCLA